MEKEQLKRIFEFLETKEGLNAPFIWKLKTNIPLTEDDLNIKGDLDLYNSSITSLPEGLKIVGYLTLTFSKITLLPNNLQVGGDLALTFSKITSLPEGLEVGNNLFIGTSPLTKYSDKELRDMIKPGFIKGEIYR